MTLEEIKIPDTMQDTLTFIRTIAACPLFKKK